MTREYTGPTTFTPLKTYTIDMEKVMASDDVNTKLNAMFTIFSEVNITIQEWAISDDLRKFVKEN